MNPQIEKDAKQFGLYASGWRLGLLVARCVEKGKGHGGDRKSDQRRNHDVDLKVGARVFAKAAGTSADRVLRHLEAWNLAAADGVKGIKPSATLSPGDEPKLNYDSLPDWSDYYTSVSGGFNGGKDRSPTEKNVEDALDSLSPDARARVVGGALGNKATKEAVKRNPLVTSVVAEVAAEAWQESGQRSEEKGKTRSKKLAAKDALAHIQGMYDDVSSAVQHAADAEYEIVRWSVAPGDDWFDRMPGLIDRTRTGIVRLNARIDRIMDEFERTKQERSDESRA